MASGSAMVKRKLNMLPISRNCEPFSEAADRPFGQLETNHVEGILTSMLPNAFRVNLRNC